MKIDSEYRQGVSDANIIALQNVPVVDGLGPLGGRDHSEDEFMIKESMAERCNLLAQALRDPSAPAPEITYMSWGSDNTAPTVNDIALGSEYGRARDATCGFFEERSSASSSMYSSLPSARELAYCVRQFERGASQTANVSAKSSTG